MKVELAVKKFERFAQDLSQNGLAYAMLRAAESSRAMIFHRVTETGTDAEGKQYTPYSTKPMLTNCSALLMKTCDQLAGSKEKRRELHWVTLQRVNRAGKRIRVFELEGGYKQFRDLQGRQTGFVDFSFTGDMWKSIQVTTGMDEARKGHAVITANNDKDMAKLVGNTERRTDILALSESEINTISEIFEEEIMDMLRNYDLV